MARIASRRVAPRRTGHRHVVSSGGRPTLARDRRVTNLHAFGRLYGVVRWFQPSNAAASLDWERFAIDGVRRVIDAPDTHALRTALVALFRPFAPAVEIAGPGETWHTLPPAPPRPSLLAAKRFGR